MLSIEVQNIPIIPQNIDELFFKVIVLTMLYCETEMYEIKVRNGINIGPYLQLNRLLFRSISNYF